MTSAHKLVYIETSVVSYLTARPTSDLLAAAWQKTTVDWWEEHRSAYNVCTSQLTIEEAAIELASSLMRDEALLPDAVNDALHIRFALPAS